VLARFFTACLYALETISWWTPRSARFRSDSPDGRLAGDRPVARRMALFAILFACSTRTSSHRVDISRYYRALDSRSSFYRTHGTRPCVTSAFMFYWPYRCPDPHRHADGCTSSERSSLGLLIMAPPGFARNRSTTNASPYKRPFSICFAARFHPPGRLFQVFA